MELLPALLALCEGNPPVTSGFPSQWDSGAEIWCFLWCQPQETAEHSQSRGRWIKLFWCSFDITVMKYFQYYLLKFSFIFSRDQWVRPVESVWVSIAVLLIAMCMPAATRDMYQNSLILCRWYQSQPGSYGLWTSLWGSPVMRGVTLYH